ncbi:hypothetical protein ACH3VR_07400 [Microbacterium sp. B2969]|uniref:Orc1-like AAA ATPase domain-containing protein n=1 Tax=Microbacterium alkaliflavum TaxID=3248839 RepID=A0ABW7Q712_9MICO
MPELAPISDHVFAELLGSLAPTGHDEPPRHESLREFVVLVAAFDADSLKAVGATDDDLDDFLVEDCEQVFTRAGRQWGLRLGVRQSTLAALEAAGRLEGLHGAVDPKDVASTMALRYIAGTAPSLEDQTVEELQGTAIASDWLARTNVKLPRSVEAKAQQSIDAMLNPLRLLVADGVFGRDHELAVLADYAEVLSPSSRAKGAVRRVKRILNLTDKPPLVIHGLGGVGKSTLVARFVLDHVDAGASYRFPFAYLSFDRPELQLEQPLTLLAEAATQLAALFPDVASDAAAVAESTRGAVASALLTSLSDRRASKVSWSTARGYTDRDVDVLLDRFAQLVAAATGRHQLPTVWVLDTFEVAQRQSPVAADELWDFLERLQRACPRLRVVICGRTPIEGRRTRSLALGNLTPAAAHDLLRTQLAPLDLPDSFIAGVAQAVPPHPLSLRLAVLLIRREAELGLATDERRRDVLFQLEGANVQGVLYRRVLAHIEDPDVRRLANPGLVVRRITPDVIQDVLAKPCGLGAIDRDAATALFDKLQREVAVVIPIEGGTLIQRPELRKLMLPLVTHDDPELVAKLRRAALAFYRRRGSVEDKVEELYYRLALGQSTATLDKSFDPEAARVLMEAVDEFPPSSQVYLANRIGVTVDPAILHEADDLSWARQAVLSSRRLLDSGRAEAALEIVTGRRNDTIVPFTGAIEVEALASLHRTDEALTAARATLKWATEHHDSDTFIDVALLAARIAEDAGDTTAALSLLSQAESAAASAQDMIAGWVARVAIVRVHRRSGSSDSDQALKARARLVDEIDQLTPRDRSRNPSLVRDLAAEIGDDVPSIARDALRLSGHTAGPVPTTRRRRRHPDPNSQLTSAEIGRSLAVDMSADESGSIREHVSEQLRFESDGAAF